MGNNAFKRLSHLKNCCVSFLLAAIVLTSAAIVPALARTPSQAGIDSGGLICADPDVRIVSTDLKFSVPEFPVSVYAPNFKRDASFVTADYVLQSPETKKITLLMPLGKSTSAFYGRDAVRGERFSFFADGKEVSAVSRFSYGAVPSDQYDKETLSPNTPVYRYVYHIKESKESVIALLKLDGQRNLITYAPDLIEAREDRTLVIDRGRGVKTVEVYAIGRPYLKTPRVREETRSGKVVSESLALLEKSELTLKELLSKDRGYGVSKIDWYNAGIELLTSKTREILGSRVVDPVKDNLQEWLQVEVKLKAGQETTVEIQSPLYPAIDASTDPVTYVYSYRIPEEGSFEASFDTKFYRVEEQKEDGVYRVSLCEAENPEQAVSLATVGDMTLMYLALGGAIFLCADAFLKEKNKNFD